MILPLAFDPYVPPQFGIKLATEAWELAEHARLRRDVFCREQKLFVGSDRDANDARALPIVAVDYVMGMSDRVVGTVRIHEREPGIWAGSRLAIEKPYRAVHGLGSGLVARAVGTAKGLGCTHFSATVQTGNVEFFKRLFWEPLEALELYGAPHVRMVADLERYPICDPASPVAMIRARKAS